MEVKSTKASLGRRCLNLLLWLLKAISLGQHTTIFYRKKNNKYGTTLGGSVTLVVGSIFLIFSAMTLYRCISYKDITMTVEQVKVENQDIKDITVKELVDLGFPMINFNIDTSILSLNYSTFYIRDWYPVETCLNENKVYNCAEGR